MPEAKERVAVLGASDKAERYSNQAVRLLLDYAHQVVPIHPALNAIENLPALAHLDEIPDDTRIDTLTVYISAAVSSPLADAMLRLKPKRVIFNPGAENAELSKQLQAKGIAVEDACTLVLLRTGQF